MDSRVGQDRKQLFIVRLWAEDLGEGHYEWRGQVQQVPSGATRYLRGLPALSAAIETLLPTSLNDSHELEQP